jgi:GntR family transcriptional repressor for pyruvate dehydrogenase complex
MSANDSIINLKTQSLRTQVYAKLKEQLMSGVWKEGEKLPSEHELCELFGVSRVTVRAAINQLEILGFVKTKHGGGTFVKQFSSIEKIDTFHPVMQIQKSQDLITVLEYRKIIEKGTIGLAKEKITADDIRSLREMYKNMVDIDADDAAFSQADLAFHYRLAEIARNPIIFKVYELIFEILSVAMSDIVGRLGRRDGLKYHREIIDALENSDKATCEAIMEEHLNVTIQRIMEDSDS